MSSNLKATYIDNEHSRHWLQQREWAVQKLSEPDVTFPGGRSSHACAYEVLEQAEDELMDDYAIQVYG